MISIRSSSGSISRFSRALRKAFTYSRPPATASPVQIAARKMTTRLSCRTENWNCVVRIQSTPPATPRNQRSTSRSMNTLTRFLISRGMGRNSSSRPVLSMEYLKLPSIPRIKTPTHSSGATNIATDATRRPIGKNKMLPPTPRTLSTR